MRPAQTFRYWLLCVLVVWLSPLAGQAAEVSFRNEVMAILSRGGCNSGPCHGSLNGKNGFKLSLRGEDADFDLRSLTRDMQGRRINPLQPAHSLLLLKATGAVPHEGGRRFGPESAEYQLLARWISQGAGDDRAGTPQLRQLCVTPSEKVLLDPEKSVRFRVEARFSDGTTRDVTGLACYEVSSVAAAAGSDGTVERRGFGEATVLVRYLDQQVSVRLAFVPARAEFVWKNLPENNFIDRHLHARLRQLRILPSELVDDSVFLRRAYLDTLGILPPPDEVRRFLQDKRPDRRARLIDDLLNRPEFADFWALKWADLLRVEEKVLDTRGVEVFHAWIRQSIASNKPLDQFARELLTATGSTYKNAPANYYRALRDPQTRAETTAQVFLGVRIQCARCHNHPFDQWKQDDYHSLAAFFARIDYKILENNRKDRLDKHEFIGEQIVLLSKTGEVNSPRTGRPLPPRLPGARSPLPSEADRLAALAAWVTSADNPYFARAQVNRVWYHLFGRGLVEPNDDFRASNPPANPALLEELARQFVKNRFDLRWLVRTIMNSRAYQLSAITNATNAEDESNFSHALIRPVQAEVLLDALSQVTGAPLEFAGYRKGMRATQLPGVQSARQRDRRQSDSERFLFIFGKPVRSLTCECERSDETTLTQAFQLITGKLLNDMLARPDNRLGKLIEAKKSDAEIVEELYLSALSRQPTARESAAALKFLGKQTDRRAALEDFLWALVNSKEFLLRQ